MDSLFSGMITKEDISELAASEDLILNDDERISVLHAMHSIDVQACPGSGKTTLIATKLIILANKWPFSHRGLCVLSHTNVAKDEIIKRIKKSKSPSAQRLLSYPHFIGTIQEFVNRNISIPYLRSIGIKDIIVDSSEYIKYSRKLIDLDKFSWLKNMMKGLGEANIDSFMGDTYYVNTDAGICVNIPPKRPKQWKKEENYKRVVSEISSIKKSLEKRGVFLYRDMYAFADRALFLNKSVSNFLQNRFPFILIDEMQDTQKFQDQLLQDIFPLNSNNISVQRFGDPDQAIFNGVSGEEANDSFNKKQPGELDIVIGKSHRFCNSIAKKISRLSYNQVDLISELSEKHKNQRLQLSSGGKEFFHTVILYDDTSIERVIPTYAEIVSEQFSDDYKKSKDFTVKVVGAVGNDIDPDPDKKQLKVGHYWEEYDKSKRLGNFKPSSLIAAVRYRNPDNPNDWGETYKTVLGHIILILRQLGKKDENKKWFTNTTLQLCLEEKGTWSQFRELTFQMIGRRESITSDCWGKLVSELSLILEFDSSEAASQLKFEEAERSASLWDDSKRLRALPNNRMAHVDGFDIELSTIHGVKGETHDATLVLETKYYKNDLEIMLQYFSGDFPSDDFPNEELIDELKSAKSKRPQNKRFLRQLYVAVSRPRHLLCLALHKDHFNALPTAKTDFENQGWFVRSICEIE